MQTTAPWKIEITHLLPDGRGAGIRIDASEKKEIRCWGTLPGDRVIAWPAKRERHGIDCVVEQIEKPSPQAIMPHDHHWTSCGPFGRFTREKELAWKQNYLFSLFNEEIELKFGAQRNGYRTKMEFSIHNGSLAFHQRGNWSRYISASEGCGLIPDSANKICRFYAEQLSIFFPQRIIIRWSHALEEALVTVLFEEEKNIPLTELPPKVRGCRFGILEGNAIKFNMRYGESSIHEKIGTQLIGYDYDCFFQNNCEVFSLLLKDAYTLLYPFAPAKILDWYGGVGTIGLSLLSYFPHAYGECRDSNASAIAWAKKNGEACGVTERWSAKVCLAEKDTLNLNEFSIVVLDPPRAGLHPCVISQLHASKVPLILYVSCNPMTLARDLNALKSSYKRVAIRAYDMYPTTPHLEVMVLLLREN